MKNVIDLPFIHYRKIAATVLLLFIFFSSAFSADNFLDKQPVSLQKAQSYLATNPDSAFYLAITFIEERNESTKKDELCFAYYLASSAEYLFGDLAYSDSLSVNAIKISENITNEHLLGLCCQLYAKILKVEKRFERSMTFLVKAKDHFERDNDPLKKVDITIDFSEFYRSTANFPKAEEYINSAEDQEKKLSEHDDDLLANLLNRKAAIYDEMGKTDEALELSKTSLALSEKINNLHYQATSLNEMGFIMWKKNKIECVDLYNKAISIWEKINYHYYKTSTKLNIARVYFSQKNYDRIREILLSALEEAKTKGWKGVELSAQQQIIELDKELGNDSDIPPHLMRAMELELYITKEQSNLSLLDMQEKYSTEQNKLTALEKLSEAKEAESKLSAQSKFTIFLWISIALAFFLGIGSTYFVMSRRRKNE